MFGSKLVHTMSNLKSDTISATYGKFELDALEAHNEYRSKHGVAQVYLSQKLCAFAQRWANVSIVAKSSKGF